MAAQNLSLDIPKSHTILKNTLGQSHCPPITGSVSISISPLNITPAEYPKISIALIQTITTKERNKPPVSKSNGYIIKHIRNRRASKTHHNKTRETKVCPSTHEVVKCDLWPQPDAVEKNNDHDTTMLKFNFSLPIPSFIPGTTDTMLGGVSYAIEVRATPVQGDTITTKRKLDILRFVILENNAHTVEHMRTFPGQRLKTELFLTPGIPSDSKTKATFSARVMIHQSVTPGPRAREVKYAVIKELRWHIEETVKYMIVPSHGGIGRDSAICKEQCAHQLWWGRKKGHWIAPEPLGSEKKENDAGSRIEIPFDIDIPKDAAAADDVDLSSYDFDPMRQSRRCNSSDCIPSSENKVVITVGHRLMVDIIAGEDTFDQVTSKLVDRKPLWRSFNAAFPLSIREVITGEDIPGVFDIENIPPKYENGSVKPPEYGPTL